MTSLEEGSRYAAAGLVVLASLPVTRPSSPRLADACSTRIARRRGRSRRRPARRGVGTSLPEPRREQVDSHWGPEPATPPGAGENATIPPAGRARPGSPHGPSAAG